jgi:hypothetical protein
MTWLDDHCGEPTAAGPEGIALCVLAKAHEGSCDGGALEKRIAENAHAAFMEDWMDAHA